ncbi:MAG: hypothetical protein QXU60_06340 [Sulfolobales archaeon]
MNLKDLYRDLRKMISSYDIEIVISRITSHHRIQGSKGLRYAIEDLREALRSHGIESKIYEAPLDSSRGFIETPVGWDAQSGELRIWVEEELLLDLDLRRSPTLLSAHTGSGEGCSELRFCRDDSCSGEAIITDLTPYEAYDRYDSRLIIHYNPARHPDAVPYTGLFLRSRDLKKDRVVMNIPYSKASRVIDALARDRRVKVCWSSKTEYHTSGSLPILHTCSGSEKILYISHICHPMPGAHDNASGSAGNYLIALLSRESSILRNIEMCSAWVPEHTGTAYLGEILGDSIEHIINLDMIGSNQYATGSVLTLVNPPLILGLRTASAGYIGLRTALDTIQSFTGVPTPSIRYDIAPYSAGSDHDLASVWGVENFMLNEWPSRYYHTDRDSMNTLSTEDLVSTALSAVLAGYIISDENHARKAEEIYREHLISWYATRSFTQGVDVSLVIKLIRGEIRGKIPRDLSRTPLSSRYLYKVLERDLYNKVRRITAASSYLTVYALVGELAGVREEELLDIFQAEEVIKWSDKDRSIVGEAWRILRSSLDL